MHGRLRHHKTQPHTKQRKRRYRAHGVVASQPLYMRKARGANSSVSTFRTSPTARWQIKMPELQTRLPWCSNPRPQGYGPDALPTELGGLVARRKSNKHSQQGNAMRTPGLARVVCAGRARNCPTHHPASSPPAGLGARCTASAGVFRLSMCILLQNVNRRGSGATEARLTPDQKAWGSNLSGHNL